MSPLAQRWANVRKFLQICCIAPTFLNRNKTFNSFTVFCIILVILKLYILFFYFRDLNVAVGPTLDFRCYCRSVHMNVAVGATVGQRLKVLSNYRHCANVARTDSLS